MTDRASGLALAAALLLAAASRAQVPNDTCATAIPLGLAAVTGSNAGATTGPDPLPACSTASGDVWYSFVPNCTATYTASTCAAATNFGTIVAIWDGAGGCAGLTQVACSDVCLSGGFLGASVAASLVAGHPYFVSVAGNSGSTGTFSLSVALGAAMTLAFISNGPGTLGYVITEGPEAGVAFVAMTTNAGNFPVGWFYGVDIPWLELLNEISAGYPFLAPFQPCGIAAVGPYSGLPHGLMLHAVALGIPAGSSIPAAATVPVLGVVP